MKSGATLRTLIGAVAEGVNDVITAFTPNSLHVLYYHNGHKTLRLDKGGRKKFLLVEKHDIKTVQC